MNLRRRSKPLYSFYASPERCRTWRKSRSLIGQSIQAMRSVLPQFVDVAHLLSRMVLRNPVFKASAAGNLPSSCGVIKLRYTLPGTLYYALTFLPETKLNQQRRPRKKRKEKPLVKRNSHYDRTIKGSTKSSNAHTLTNYSNSSVSFFKLG